MNPAEPRANLPQGVRHLIPKLSAREIGVRLVLESGVGLVARNGSYRRRITKQRLRRGIFAEFRSQETFIGSVLEQTPHKVSHAGQRLTERTVFPHTIPHPAEGLLDRFRHPVKHLKLEPPRRQPEPPGFGETGRNRPNVVSTKRAIDHLGIFQQSAR